MLQTFNPYIAIAERTFGDVGLLIGAAAALAVVGIVLLNAERLSGQLQSVVLRFRKNTRA